MISSEVKTMIAKAIHYTDICADYHAVHSKYFLTDNGIRLITFPSQKRGRDGVAWTALRGSACKRALAKMGDAIAGSNGVFRAEAKAHFANIWNKTNE